MFVCTGEGDRLGGLIIDVLGDTVVVQSSALWVEKHRQTLISVLTACLAVQGDKESKRIIWRRAESRLKQGIAF